MAITKLSELISAQKKLAAVVEANSGGTPHGTLAELTARYGASSGLSGANVKGAATPVTPAPPAANVNDITTPVTPAPPAANVKGAATPAPQTKSSPSPTKPDVALEREKKIAEARAKKKEAADNKLLEEFEKLNESIKSITENVKSITDTATGRRQQKTIGTKIESIKGNVKDFFTMRGFMDKTGIVKKGTGGMFDNMLQNREEKKQYVDVRKRVEKAGDPSLVQNKKYMKGLTDDWKKIQKIQNDIRKNEEAIGKMKEAGFSEEQLANTKELKFREELAKNLYSIDTRVTPEKENPKGKPKTAQAKADAVDAEARDEQIAAVEEQSKLLKQIAENTGEGKAGKVKPEKKAENDEGGGLFGGLIKNWKTSLINGFKAMFNPKMLMKLLTKVALPLLIITSIVKGLMAGFDEFKKSGSIKEAIIAGLGSILEFISFGLFDKESIRGIVNAVAGFYTEYIEKPVKEFIGAITSVFTTVSDFFKSAIESFTGLLKSIGIPEFKFRIPIVGTEVSLGPYYPFADGGAKPAPKPPAAVKPTSAAMVSGKSAENAGAAQGGGSSNVVVAPTTNVSNTKNEAIVYRHTTRNPDSTFTRHIDSRYSPA